MTSHNKNNPYQVIVRRHVTEKTRMLQEMPLAESNVCLRRCVAPKYVFLVERTATKREIAQAVEEIYSDRKIKVVKVNTINVKGKRRRMRGHVGFRPSFRKAIVTMEPGDSIDEV